MAAEHEEPAVEIVLLALPLPRRTVAWLTALSDGSDVEAARIVAGMLAEIQADDEAAHRLLH